MNRYTLLLLLAVFSVNGVIVDNLCTTSQQVQNGISFTGGGGYDRWVAYDFDPDLAYFITDISGQWMYYGGASQQGDMNFAIYLDDLNSTPIEDFTIEVADYVEWDTGFDAMGRNVYQGDLPLSPNGFWTHVGNKYWIAMQMDSEDNVFFVFRRDSIIGEVLWWYGDMDIWENSHEFYGDAVEGSYAIYGGTSGVENVSLGEIKALFR